MRKRLAVLASTIAATGVLAAVAAASASAVELPEFTVESSVTGTSGKGTLNIGTSKISCEKGEETAMPTSKKLGLSTKTVHGCKLGGEQCHSLGDAAGIVLVTGTGSEYHIVRAVGGGSVLTWLLVPSTHVECQFAATLITIKGNVLGKITPINTKTKKFSVEVTTTAGKQSITKFSNDEGKEVEAKLEGSLNGGEFKAATIESAENSFTTEKETEITHTA